MDCEDGFLEDKLDRPQISITALIKDINPNDIVEIWELTGLAISYKHHIVLLSDGRHLCTCMAIINRDIVCAHFFQVMMSTKMARFHIGLIAKRWYQDDQQDKEFSEILQQQSVEISTKFQQESVNLIIPDLHIIGEIRGGDLHNAEICLVVDKKVRYANGFGKMKKALNIALDLGCEEELINIITGFIDQKKILLENINNDNNDNTYPRMIILDPLVTK